MLAVQAITIAVAAIRMARMIDVYFIDVNVANDVIDALANLLTTAERARADRYRFADDRRRSIVARAATRRFLGRYLNADPATLVIDEEEFGKPVLRGRAIEFNASHSGDLVAARVRARNGRSASTSSGAGNSPTRSPWRAAIFPPRRWRSSNVPRILAMRSSPSGRRRKRSSKRAAKASARAISTASPSLSAIRELRPVIDGWSVAAIDPNRDGYYAAVAAREANRPH